MAKQTINNLESAATVRKKINDNFTELFDTKVPTDHSSMGTQYGAATNEVFGHIKVTPGNGLSIDEGVLSLGLASEATPGAVQLASTVDSGDATKVVTALQVKNIKDNVTSLQENTSPKNHASTTTTYGVGSTTSYGHLKVNASNGLGVNNGILSMNAATTSQAGTVRLVDSLSSQSTIMALTAKQGYMLDQKKPDVYTGTSAPSSSIGKNGDIYFLLG